MRRITDDANYWRRTAVMVLARVRLGYVPRELAPLFGVGIKQVERLLRTAAAKRLREQLEASSEELRRRMADVSPDAIPTDDDIVGTWYHSMVPDSPF